MVKLEGNEKIKKILALDNDFDRFEYITDIALGMKDFSDIRKEENKIKNCETGVYYRISEKDGKYVFELESDSLYIKGLYCIYSEIVYNLGVNEIINLHYYDFLKSNDILPYDRYKGLGSVEEKFKEFIRQKG